MKPQHREDNYKKYLQYIPSTDVDKVPYNFKIIELVKGLSIYDNHKKNEFDLMSIAILAWTFIIVSFSFVYGGLIWPIYCFALFLLLIILSRVDNHDIYSKALHIRSKTASKQEAAVITTRYNLKIIRKKYLWLFIIFTFGTSLTMVCGFRLFNFDYWWMPILSALTLSSIVWYYFWGAKSTQAARDLVKFEKDLKLAKSL